MEGIILWIVRMCAHPVLNCTPISHQHVCEGEVSAENNTRSRRVHNSSKLFSKKLENVRVAGIPTGNRHNSPFYFNKPCLQYFHTQFSVKCGARLRSQIGLNF